MNRRFEKAGLGLLAALTVLVALFAMPLGAQQFGSQVLISGDELLISEPVSERNPTAVYRYRLTSDGWVQAGTIAAPPHDSPSDYFGRVVVADDRSLLIGGTLYENSTGAVWAYRRSGDDWVFDQLLQPEEVVEEEAFGRFGLLSGNLFFVSSLGFQGSGAVWVYERNASGQWDVQARLQPRNVAPVQEFFGWDMDFDGERLIVGSFAGEDRPGAAYIFTRDDSGAWVEEARLALPATEQEAGDAAYFGGPGAGTIGVGWYRGMALFGLPGRNNAEGAVYTFRRHPSQGNWVRGTTLSAFDREPGASFGHEFYEHDGDLWVSAPAEGVGGSIYRFEWDPFTSSFGAATKIRNSIDPDVGDAFGFVVDIAGDLGVVGQPGDDGGLGSAIVLRYRNGEWSSEVKLMIPEPPGLPAIAGSEVQCGESGEASGFTCSGVDLLSFLPLSDIGAGRGVEGNEIWGWTDPETGAEIAIVGRTDGTAFVDISDPQNPRYLGSLPKTPGTLSEAWRDFKVFRNYAFVVADGAGDHGMQVFDLTRLREVTGNPMTFFPDALYEGVASAHNVAINEETGTAYVVGSNMGGETCSGGLHMVDINDPLNPTFLGCFAHPETGRAGTGYTHDALCVIYRGPDAEYRGREICFNSNETALSIADVTDRSEPVAVASASYPNVAYAHQGWLTDDHRYFFLGDELDEQEARFAGRDIEGTRTLVWDVTDLDDPILATEYFGVAATIDHNLYIRGNLMYQSNYESGLRILNIADPENPVEVGFFDTIPDSDRVEFNGSWGNYPFFESGTIVLGSRREGVFFVRFRPQLVQ